MRAAPKDGAARRMDRLRSTSINERFATLTEPLPKWTLDVHTLLLHLD